MGYHETVCQLCGVSFAIARLRRADEPESAAWDHLGANYIGEEPEYEDEKEEDIINRTCGGTRNSGCYLLNRLPDHSDSSPSKEHISGPGCASTRGYSGHRISLEEMKGCRTVQCLVKKEEGWQAEKGDEKWEVESAYFLSGYGEGRSLKGGSLSNIRPRRHGIDSLYCGNVPSRHPEDEVVNGDEDGLGIVCLTYYDDDERKGIPFHPSCFEIFKRVSLHQTRKIDVHGLWSWHSRLRYESFHTTFPRHPAVQTGRHQYWNHKRGNEFLIANPLHIPTLNSTLLNPTYTSSSKSVLGNIDSPLREREGEGDPFATLSAELKDIILAYLSTIEIASLRLCSPSFWRLPTSLFRRLLLEDIPWFWEVHDRARNPPSTDMDWYHLYLDSKFCTGQFAQLKGYRNRKRIWSDVEEIFRQIRVLRGEGKCERDWTGWLPDWWEPICGNMYDSWDEGDVEVYWGGGEYGVGNLERDFVDESDSDEDMGF